MITDNKAFVGLEPVGPSSSSSGAAGKTGGCEPGALSDPVSAVLPGNGQGSLPGLTMTGEGRGHLDFDPEGTEVQWEPLDVVHILRTVKILPKRLPHALHANRFLSENMRTAVRGDRIVLAVDLRHNGNRHLPAAIAELPSAFEFAQRVLDDPNCEPAFPDDRFPAVNCDQVEKLLCADCWPDGAVVRNEDCWELRPRLHDRPVPVRVVIDGARIRVYRAVLDVVPSAGDPHWQAITDHSARLNARLRGARLAVGDRHLVAETRLLGKRAGPDDLKHAVYAVAVAARRAEPVLSVLARNREIAGNYVRMFRTDKERSAIRFAEK